MIPKFRAWDKNQQIMRGVRGLFWTKNNLVAHCSPMGNKFDKFFTTILNDGEHHLMQSTGLKDKNGVEIFEGDCFIKIFRTIETPTGKNGIEKSVGIVKFHEGAFQVHIDGWGYELLSEVAQPHIYGANDDYWENVVIGNIYENPELLEVEG